MHRRDLFHASNEIVKLFGLRLNNKLATIKDKVIKETAALAIMMEMGKDISVIDKQKALINVLNQEEAVVVLSIDRYRMILRDISMVVHPFDIKTGSIKTSGKTRQKRPRVLRSKRNTLLHGRKLKSFWTITVSPRNSQQKKSHGGNPGANG